MMMKHSHNRPTRALKAVSFQFQVPDFFLIFKGSLYT